MWLGIQLLVIYLATCSHHSLCSKRADYPCLLSKCSITLISVSLSHQTFLFNFFFFFKGKHISLHNVAYVLAILYLATVLIIVLFS